MIFTSKLLAGITAVVMSLLSLTGCIFTDPAVIPPDIEKPDNPSVEHSISIEKTGFTDYNTDLIKFMSEKKSGENFSVSPLSIKYAIGMATAGAAGDTQKELVEASGMSSVEVYNNWAKEYLEYVNECNGYWAEKLEWLQKYEKSASEQEEYKISNSLWKVKRDESDTSGFEPKYTEDMLKYYGGEVKSVSLNDAVSKINDWVSDNTNGKIKTIISDVSPELASVLVNTVYLKLNWAEEFNDAIEKKDWFTDVNGNKQTKEVMTLTDDVIYYEDDDCQMISLHLSGSINMAFVLGDSNKTVKEMLSGAKSQRVNVSIPKFIIESEFNNGEIMEFYVSKGVNKAFSDNANFSAMLGGQTGDFTISDIVHKTYVECQEKGIEAAAATAIMMEANAAITEKPVKPKEFTADKPFAFYIYSDRYNEENPDEPVRDLIFYGQYVV